MGSLFSRVRSIKRFLIICFILFRQVLILWPLPAHSCTGRKQEKVISKYLRLSSATGSALPEMAKETLEKLGPTYVKFGQFMSIRPDLIPHEFCTSSRNCRTRSLPFPFAQVKRELKNELKRDPAEIFSEFDETPLAAASVSQVHRARLRTRRRGGGQGPASGHPGGDGLGHPHHAVLREPSRAARSLAQETRARRAHPRVLAVDRPRALFPPGREERPPLLLQLQGLSRRQRSRRSTGSITTRTILVMEYIRGVNILHAPDEGIDRKAVAASSPTPC